MLRCKTCKTNLQIKTNYVVLANYYINYSGLNISDLDIVESPPIKYTLFCPTCNKEVKHDDIETKCYLCSDPVPLDQAIVVQGRGNYHKSCADLYFAGEPTKKLITLIRKDLL